MLTVTAPAKINLTLEVLGKRPDGYHQIVSIFQAIELCDTLSLELSDGMEFSCSRRDLEGPENLVPGAARLLREVAGSSKGARIHLTKAIPVAAGLGGGSSDAAAALEGLNRLWGLGMSLEALWPLASRLGSDVPFFLYGGTALVEGRGERVTPLPDLPRQWVVLLRPPTGEMAGKTRQLYAALKPEHYTQGQHTARLIAQLRDGGKFEPAALFNVFEGVAGRVFGGIDSYGELMVLAGATAVHLAGSGPTLFAVSGDQAKAESIYGYLGGSGVEVYLAATGQRRL